MTLTEKQARKWAELKDLKFIPVGQDFEHGDMYESVFPDAHGVYSQWAGHGDQLFEAVPDYHTDDTALVDWLDLVVKDGKMISFWPDETKPDKTVREAAISGIDEFCGK